MKTIYQMPEVSATRMSLRGLIGLLRRRRPVHPVGTNYFWGVVPVVLLLWCGTICSGDAQQSIMGNSATTGKLISYHISQSRSGVAVTLVGELFANSYEGHLTGRYLPGGKEAIMRIRRMSSSTVEFSAPLANGGLLSQSLRLPAALGERFQVLGSFDLDNDGVDELGLVDQSERFLRWHIIRNPLRPSVSVVESFQLGRSGERAEWTKAPTGMIQFIAFRSSALSRRMRVIIRTALINESRALRAKFRKPLGYIEPTRLVSFQGGSPRIGFYVPGERAMFFFVQRKLQRVALPRQRCSGEQVITGMRSRSAVSVVEFCKNSSFIVSERNKAEGEDGDVVTGSGVLQEPVRELRRGDVTSVVRGIEEVPILIAEPGSSSAPFVGQPILTPTAIPTGTGTPVAAAPPLQTIQLSSWAPLPRATKQLIAFGSYSDGSVIDVSSQVTWSSSDPTVVGFSNSVGEQGKARALRVGATTIAASVNGVVGTVAVTVSPAMLIAQLGAATGGGYQKVNPVSGELIGPMLVTGKKALRGMWSLPSGFISLGCGVGSYNDFYTYQGAVPANPFLLTGLGTQCPHGVFPTWDDNLLVVDYNNQQVLIHRLSDGAQIGVFGAGDLSSPFRAVELADRRIIVPSWTPGKLVAYSRSGTSVTKIGDFASGFSNPWGIEYCPKNDTILVSDYNVSGSNQRVWECTSSGICRVLVNHGIKYPLAIRLDANAGDCSFYVSFTDGRIVRFAENGAITHNPLTDTGTQQVFDFDFERSPE